MLRNKYYFEIGAIIDAVIQNGHKEFLQNKSIEGHLQLIETRIKNLIMNDENINNLKRDFNQYNLTREQLNKLLVVVANNLIKSTLSPIILDRILVKALLRKSL